MRSIRFKLILMFAAMPMLVASARSQELARDFGTVEGTNALAATAGFIDIVGIKLGMPAEEAMALLRKNNPGAKITLERTADYQSAWYRLEREDPKRKWVYGIDVTPAATAGDNFIVGLSLPPSKQVVQTISRIVLFKDPVALENIVSGLRQKYGQESYGLDHQNGGMNFFDVLSEKHLLWVFDPQGHQVKPEAVTKHGANSCQLSGAANVALPEISLRSGRPYNREDVKQNPCMFYVMLDATIHMAAPARGLAGQASSFTVSAFDWPLVTSGANALYTFLDQGAREIAAKQAADAKKRGTDLKY